MQFLRRKTHKAPPTPTELDKHLFGLEGWSDPLRRRKATLLRDARTQAEQGHLGATEQHAAWIRTAMPSFKTDQMLRRLLEEAHSNRAKDLDSTGVPEYARQAREDWKAAELLQAERQMIKNQRHRPFWKR